MVSGQLLATAIIKAVQGRRGQGQYRYFAGGKQHQLRLQTPPPALIGAGSGDTSFTIVTIQ